MARQIIFCNSAADDESLREFRLEFVCIIAFLAGNLQLFHHRWDEESFLSAVKWRMVFLLHDFLNKQRWTDDLTQHVNTS